MKKYRTSLFIFRRDLRIEDNTGLRVALENSQKVIPCFIVTPEQTGPENSFRSMNALQCMVESLEDLAAALQNKKGQLFIFSGHPAHVVEQLIQSEPVEAVFVNRDYTPYSRARDTEIETVCTKNGIRFHSSSDSLLVEPEDGVNPQGKPYQVFTPFFNKNRQLPVAKPIYHHHTHYAAQIKSHSLPLSFLATIVAHKSLLFTQGGRTEALKLMQNLSALKHYETTHDQLALQTSGLSAHNKFGTISIRELYYTLVDTVGERSGLVRQLYWRDFFTHVAWFHPQVFGHAFKKKFDQIPWSSNVHHFERWCTGTTGFPIVDAGMRQLNATGYMHNRTRLIVGSFLTKDLHISWLWGEKYFAQQLEDYDPCVNNGNWQWIASTGCDAQPYFRIFNPWLQQKKFDPDCIYIKRWIPELAPLSPHLIHGWHTRKESINEYPAPMLNHALASKKAKELYAYAAALSSELLS